MKSFLVMFLIAMFTLSFADQPIRKIQIHNADPALIILILANKTNTMTPPEISTNIFGSGGFGGGNTGSGFGSGGWGGGNNSGFRGGR